MSFAPPDVLTELPKMTPAQLDALGFGVVGLTDGGDITKYNKYQSDLAGVPQAQALGKAFFKDVAPCTQNGLFYHQFKKGVEAGKLEASFPYTFTCKMTPTDVAVQLYRDPATRTNWVLVKRS